MQITAQKQPAIGQRFPSLKEALLWFNEYALCHCFNFEIKRCHKQLVLQCQCCTDIPAKGNDTPAKGFRVKVGKVRGRSDYELTEYRVHDAACKRPFRLQNSFYPFLVTDAREKPAALLKRLRILYPQCVVKSRDTKHLLESRRAEVNGVATSKLYQKLRGFASQLEHNGDFCLLETDQGVFKRIAVSWGATINAFAHSRPILSVDGTFQHHREKGILLTAIAIDAVNSIFPVAFAIVATESVDNYIWFFQFLRNNCNIFVSSDLVVHSDQAKGLRSALVDVFPEAHQAVCAKHLWRNIQKNHSRLSRSSALAESFWTMIYSLNPAEFDHHLGIIEKDFRPVHDQLSKGGCLGALQNARMTVGLNGIVTSNHAESFNNQIKDMRDLSIPEIVCELHCFVISKMMLCQEKFATIENRGGRTARILPEIAARMELKATDQLRPRLHSSSEITVGDYVVNFQTPGCSCGIFAEFRHPCKHMVAANEFARLKIPSKVMDMEALTHPSYFITSARRAFSLVPTPISWIDVPTSEEPCRAWPLERRTAGRPRNKVRPSRNSYYFGSRYGRTKRSHPANEESSSSSSSRPRPKKTAVRRRKLRPSKPLRRSKRLA